MQDTEGLLSDSNLMATTELCKGKGKADLGKGKANTKGKGHGSRKGDYPNPPEPTPKTEEELLEDALVKCRKMRDMTMATWANFELALQPLKKSKFWSKAAQKDAEVLKDQLEFHGKELKNCLLRHAGNFDKIKGAVVEAAGTVKEAQAQMKEFKQLASKALSKATSSKSKR